MSQAQSFLINAIKFESTRPFKRNYSSLTESMAYINNVTVNVTNTLSSFWQIIINNKVAVCSDCFNLTSL